MSERHEHENVMAGPITEGDLCKIKEAVCLQVEKIYDSCKEKDCIEDLEVFGLPKNLVKRAIDVACKEVEIENVIIDVEPLRFKRGYYTVTVSYLFRVCVELFFKNQPPHTRCGVAMFTKKVVLFGSQGRVKIFKSKFRRGKADIQYTPFLEQDNRPNGKVEVAEPVCLAARIIETEEPASISVQQAEIMNSLLAYINQQITQTNIAPVDIDVKNSKNVDIDVNIEQENIIQPGPIRCERKVVVTVGLFTIIKLVRMVQLLVPAFGFCNPPTCIESTNEDPCDFFNTIEFPREDFFPLQKHEVMDIEGEEHMGCR